MINIVDHTTEVIKAEVPLLVKIIIFLVIIAFTRLNKSKKENNAQKTKAKPQVKPNQKEEDVFARMQEATNGEFWDQFTDREPTMDEFEKQFSKFDDFHEEDRKETPHYTSTTQSQRPMEEHSYSDYKKSYSHQNDSSEKNTTNTEGINTLNKKRKQTSKSKGRFDLRQAVIAETVLNRKYS